MQRKIVGLLIFTLLSLLVPAGGAAQEVRYVSKSGAYSYDGKSWNKAKSNIQDAINDLVDNGLTGEVWVAQGTYTPTESTESTGGSTLYMSFKIPAGISVYGGFKGDETSKDAREVNISKPLGNVYKYATVLSGDLSSSAEFTWNTTKERWETSFYGNCYHVVFFATNGFDATGRAKPNGGGRQSALLEGCVIEHGNAYNSDLSSRAHNAYGGGVYMVEGSCLKNCVVRQCVSYRDGGGIYMDGGGYVDHTAVMDCQTVGVGNSYGIGGGVCMDGPDTYGASSTPMVMHRSGVFGCVGRMGGGVAIIANDTIGDNKYKTACSAIIVANNTATSEAGGIYTNRGGAIAQATVVNNKCNGAGIVTNGITNGRSAGIYCRDNAIVSNSVLWGGKCSANNDIQYASSRSGSSTALSPNIMYTSLSQSDYTDWSGVIKDNVTKLSKYNSLAEGTAYAAEGYPLFTNPTPNAGYVSSAQGTQFIYDGTSTIADGVTLYDNTGAEVSAAGIKPGATYYTDAAMQTVAVEGQDYTYLGAVYDFQPLSRSSLNHRGVLMLDLDRYGQTPAYQIDQDVTGKSFTPRPTLGAYITTDITIEPQTVTGTSGETTVNFYVDPNDDGGTEHASIGSSWSQPIRFFSDAMTFIKEQSYPSATTVNVYVKEGTVNNTNTSYVGRIRTMDIGIPGNVNIYGGYPSANTGTSLDGRDPTAYLTTITGDTQDDYDLNVAHLLTFDATENTVLDGFAIRNANARGTEMIEGTPVTAGAAMTFNNATGVKIRNCSVAGHTASEGAAADMVNSEVYFENCIFHNNESRALDANGNAVSNTGNILVRAGSTASFSHCNFLRNVGNAIDIYGTVTVVNSMFYGNMREPLEDTRNNEDKALPAVRLFSGGSFAGDHNLFDSKSAAFIANNGLDGTNEAILTYTFSNTSTTYPRFMNPTKNAGVSPSGNVTYYGKATSFMPHNNNPMVNRASTVGSDGAETDEHTLWGTDMTGIVTRDYGGLPDIGAIENHESTVADEGEKAYPNGQKAYGKVIYVRDYRNADGTVDTGTTGRDGSSWSRAVNGNATYGSVKGFQYALNTANAQWTTEQTTLREVLVGAGTYTANLTWKEGVNVKGGYPAEGNPGENERNISNSDPDYMTVIDGNANGRVLFQNKDFASSVIFEGFTIQNGQTTRTNYGAGVYLRSNGTLKNCLVQNNKYSASSTSDYCQGGGGIYMNDGSIVKNCKIMKNEVTANDYKSFFGGAGVYAAGGTLINSLIVENTTESKQHNLLGAGFYIYQTSSIYNCTIAYNEAKSAGPYGDYAATGGVWDAAAKHSNGSYSNQSHFYNCIIWGNYANGKTAENMIQVGMSGFYDGAGSTNDAFHSCYSSAWSSKYASDDATNANLVRLVGSGGDGYATDYTEFYNNCLANEPFVRAADGTTDYSLKATATQCINMGSEYDTLTDYDIIVDINGEERIQDCTIDKGAYEYDQSLDIKPETTTATGATYNRRVFYVTPEGKGSASADSPANAACASKLQKVLDTAGRYKYTYPTDTVIVKVANSASLAANGEYFQYYACRTTDEYDQSARVWSIIVPRGVEVWGGYTDTFSSADNNGFYTKDTTTGVTTDNRDITGNPTYFDSYYYNKSEKQYTYTYHVVTFTDRVFDGDGKPYKKDDPVGGSSTWEEGSEYMSMSEKTDHRAVIDGLFVTGGSADAQVTSNTNATANINQYGGAAIVTDYAHVRNCIVRGNKGVYGGALALTHNALVSGCLIDQNTADYGGAVYMFEEGATLSDGTVIDTKSSGTAVDEQMAHVYTSTIVNNTANKQGGGIWFGQRNDDMNIRVNSSVIWQNNSVNQANVSGLYNATKDADDPLTTMEFYPFAFCAVQNQLVPGLNNIQLENLNSSGVRFAAKDNADDDHNTIAEESTSDDTQGKYDDFGYYALTNYSSLVRNGMPSEQYTSLVTGIGLSASDFAAVDRLVSTGRSRTSIEIGARALDKVLDKRQLMLRIFVAKPEDIDMDAAQTMMNLAGSAASGSPEEYYSQEGSSFAFPMQSLQEAIDYIMEKRSLNEAKTGLNHEGANNLPFEICLGKGTYYPRHNIDNVHINSSGNSFAIPEGVSVYGGFAIGNPDREKSYFGRYYAEGDNPANYTNVLSDNVKSVVETDDDTLVSIGGANGYTIDQLPISGMKPRRRTVDNNGNNIIEPWEFKNQTILSGDVDFQAAKGSYHVVTLVADQNVTGMLPKAAPPTSDALDYDTYTAANGDGSYAYEQGQDIVLDGLQIVGGHALHYTEGSTDHANMYNHYLGGGVFVNGNRYCDDYNKKTSPSAEGFGTVEYKHPDISESVGYRNIPLTIVNCKFSSNEAGGGGALCSNGLVSIYNSVFEQNRSVSGSETLRDSNGDDKEVSYAGVGGAVVATYRLEAYNTLFANNEAYDKNLSEKPSENKRILDGETRLLLGGAGGAVYMGRFGFFHILNCDFVRNRANAYPVMFTMNPNRDFTDGRNGGIGKTNSLRPNTSYYNQFVNTLFWGNDINDEMSKKYDSNPLFKFNSRLICNYAPGEFDTYSAPDFTDNAIIPADQTALDANSNAKNSDFGETAWFCAYEDGRGVTPHNETDMRECEYRPYVYVRDMIHSEGLQKEADTYQNSNLRLSSENTDLEGPNFVNPSLTPGFDGYYESADWSPARLSNLVDNGSGKIAQDITLEDEVYKTSFKKYTSGNIPSRSVYYNGGNTDGYTTDNVGDYDTEGFYTTLRVLNTYSRNRTYMPAGEMAYMKSAATGQELYRISYDPNPTHNQTHIDIGVYEYPHTELQYTTSGDEVDILWVSPFEKPDNGLPDGSAWSQPTSDLQRAIETLLASRNGHRKEIRLMNGTFTPIYNIEDKLAFTIDTRTINEWVTMPVKAYEEDGKTVKEYDTGKGVVSLTIKGGYSRELNNVYNPLEYPAVIRQQARANATSDRWNYLFYVHDGTQRYGYNTYNEANGYGNYANDSDGEGHNKTVNTIPLHIDGVTLVNNQANKDVNGAAIHYADLADDITAPTPGHVSVNTYYTDTGKSEESEEPTRYYNRTVDKYYTDATYQVESETATPFVTYKYVETAANKVVISKSKIMNSGSYTADDYSASAVYIGKNGGNALLYNNVMHSNTGNPLVSAVPTTIVNNTYALNKGRVDLNGENTRVSSLVLNQDDDDGNYDPDGPMLAPQRRRAPSAATGSAIFNSVFWRNNNDGVQFVLPGFVSTQKSGDIFSHNAVTGYSTEVSDYSLPDIPDQNYNVGLSDENSDIINGPNFTDPKQDAATTADIESRDFTLLPSLRLLNKGDNALYNDNITKYPDTYNIYDLAWQTTTRTDAGGEQRFVYDIDLGAYEYQNNLNRIIYVNPNVNAAGLGNSWSDPVSYGNLQAAIDLAAVYHVNNVSEEAYVFVKGAGTGSAGLHLGESVIMRDGVSVYGSILPTRTEDCPFTTTSSHGIRKYAQTDIDKYVAAVTAERGGLADPTAGTTTISGIKTPSSTTFDNTNAEIVSVVDGFAVTAANSKNPSGTVTQPVINVQPLNADGRVALRNIIVHGNDLSAQRFADLATVDNALIYEALFRDNKVDDTGCHLRIGRNGYGVNLTVEGRTVGSDGRVTYNGTDSMDGDHIFNSLVNYAGHPATENTLSGYNYKVSDPNLNYQLTEKSQHIDQCDAANPIESVTTLKQFINYGTDRDLLGNPRLLKGVSAEEKIDRGAFETWRVDQDAECTSKDTDGNLTNYYPHPGSVVYIMQGKSLVMEPYAAAASGGTAAQTSGTPLRPAYLLVQDGASLYGNGNTVSVGYVGVEREVSKDGSMVSLPYDMRYKGTDIASNGVGSPSYTGDGVLTLTADNAGTYSYNGVGRSAWNSTFHDTASPLWTELADATTDANHGILYKSAADKLYRFTAQGDPDDMDTYVYTETADGTYKTVELQQYDDRVSTDGAADFTEKEDMGWNCFGLPWLVSDYNTAETETFSGDSRRNMDIPHTLWLWYDGKTYPDGTTAADGDGGFYSVSSWDTSDWHLATGDKARIWAGEGIFAQTAAVADKEEVNFYRPVYDPTTRAKGADAPAVRHNVRRYAAEPDIEDARGDIEIHVYGHEVCISGLQGGEKIDIYDASGRRHATAKAQGKQYSTVVAADGVYIVKVDGKQKKVIVR